MSDDIRDIEARYDAELDEMIGELEAASWTDEEISALNLREYKPGYYYNDPRYPNLQPDDRYAMDHPGPPKITTPQPPRKIRTGLHDVRWDDEMFSGKPVNEWVSTRNTNQPGSRFLQKGPIIFEVSEPKTRSFGLWLCQVCRRQQAIWPTEIAWQRMIFGLRVTIIVRSPYVCTDCRVMRFRDMRPLTRLDYRPFWQNVISLWTGTTQTLTPKWIRSVNRWRSRRRHGW